MKLFDAHNDLLTQKENPNYYLNNFYNQGLCKIILAIFLSENNLNIEEIINLTNSIKDKNNVYFAIEDISVVPYLNLDILKRINPLYCSLTWNTENKLAGGAFSKKDITILGYKYINKIEEFSFIDTAHLNKKYFY